MTRRQIGLFGAIAGVSVLALGIDAFAQVTQQNLEGALRPIPPSLQVTRGLPTRGGAPQPETITHFGPQPGASTAPRPSYQANRRAPAPVAAATVAPSPPKGCAALGDTVGKVGASLPQIDFEFGSAQLKPEAADVLRKLGKALNEGLADQKLFQIQGHTDAVGSFEYNKQLSTTRAEAVKDFLVREAGVAESRLQAVGASYCKLMNKTDPAGAENRRVVIVNLTS
jgi:outer membrane protein OmpA-like peptidoglycan-associated protein